MGLKPEDIERQEFTSTLRGFDRIEVREFLHRVAELVRGLEEERDAAMRRLGTADADDQRAQDELELARRAADELRATAVEEAARIVQEAEAHGQQARLDVDRLGVDADRIRQQSMQLAEQRRKQVDALVEQRRAELDELADRRRREVAELVRSERARIEAAGRMAEVARQEAEVARQEAEAARAQADADFEQAHAELEQARRQAAQLLEHARAQSEFLRAEADELIRVKVRTTTAQAEERLGILRTTEQASRERIRAAQRELDAALRRLDSEPAPALAPGTDDVVLDEVRVRTLAATTMAQEAAPSADEATSDGGWDVLAADPTEAAPVVEDNDDGHDDQTRSRGLVDLGAGTEVASAARPGRVPLLHPSIPAALVGSAPSEVGPWPVTLSARADVTPASTPPVPAAPLPLRNRTERPPIPAPIPGRAGFPSGPVRRNAVPPIPPAPPIVAGTPVDDAPGAPSGTEAALARMVKDAMHLAFDGAGRPSSGP